ncbi:MAG TPA: hypothetical protein VFB30_02725 [Spirochaetia bacterium]|nr:hypothetical protein [Spirochaetia bacterium]
MVGIPGGAHEVPDLKEDKVAEVEKDSLTLQGGEVFMGKGKPVVTAVRGPVVLQARLELLQGGVPAKGLLAVRPAASSYCSIPMGCRTWSTCRPSSAWTIRIWLSESNSHSRSKSVISELIFPLP